jgi:hypothetical protein
VRVGITGHRGLPSQTERLVEIALRSAVDSYHADRLVGVSALADGADQLFARAVLDHGGELEVIVPAEKYREGLPDACHASYDELFARARHVHRLDYVESDEQAHMAASELMLAMVNGLLAVWDGQASRGYGGTADVVAAARQRGVPVRVIWPDGARRD